VPALVETLTIDLSASREALWPLISDTERTNRWTGTGPATFTKTGEPSAPARFIAEMKVGGMLLKYEEDPFEWEVPKRFFVRRRMIGGLLRSYSFEIELEPIGEAGTRLTMRLTLDPRFAFLSPLLARSGRKTLRETARLFKEIDSCVTRGAPNPYSKVDGQINEGVFSRVLRDLAKAGVSESMANKLGELVRTRANSDLTRIRPYELADEAHLGRDEVLAAFLKAVPAGLFELRWSIVCPSCKTANDEASSLDELKEHSECHLCDISFDVTLDESIEVTFIPHESVRAVPKQFFCMGGPARTPHVVAQVNIPPNESRVLHVPNELTPLRFFARGGAASRVALDLDAPSDVRAEFGKGVSLPTVIRVRPGGTIAAHNRTTEARHAKLERLTYASNAATAAHVATMPEFRRLFSNQLLKPGTPLKVSRVSIFFSDLTGSTALYTSEGDAGAFRFVDDHFDVLRNAIEAEGGVVVKTMGDAVMAAFADSTACARGAVRAMEAFEAFRKTHPKGGQTGLKAGLYSGPCYVVTQNGVLDYFGQTVNMASRLQHLAESGEIVAVEEVANDLLADLNGLQLRLSQPFEARVKGVEGSLRLVRVIAHTTMSNAPPAASE